MTAAGKRNGRPIKPALPGERPSLGLKVTASTKALIEALAHASGRTQSQEAEYLVERCLQYDSLVLAARVTPRQLTTAQARLLTITRDERAAGEIADRVRPEPSRATS